MQVYVNGFTITEYNEHFPLSAFFAQLGEFTTFRRSGRDHCICVGERDGCFVGLLAKTVDDNPEPFLTFENGVPRFIIDTTPGPGARQRFMFFAINKTSESGVITRYHGSGTVHTFAQEMRQLYNFARKEHLEVYRQEQEESEEGLDAEWMRSVRQGTIDILPYFLPGTFLSQLRNVHAFTELAYVEPRVQERSFTTIRDEVERRYCKVKFKIQEDSRGRFTNRSRRAILDFINEQIIDRIHPEKVTVHHVDQQNEALPPITLDPQIGSLREYKYQDVVREENLVATNIAEAPILRQLVGVLRQEGAMFDTNQG